MKKNGFTLIELLAVIVIIALIALITIPVVGNIIENSRKEAFKRSVEGLSREYEYREVQSDTKLGSIDACTLQDPCKIEGTIKRDTNGEVVLYVTDGRYCTNGKVGSFTVINGTCGVGSGIEEITFNNPNYEVNYSKNNQVIDITPNGGSGDFTYTKLSEKNSLNEDTNYVEVNDSTLIVKPSISVGTYIVSVRIKDNETKLEKEVNIVITIDEVSISNIEIADIESIDYDGTAQKPNIVVVSNGSILEENIDYEVIYENNINAGTATIKITGKGNYVGEITKTFTINKVNAPNTSVVGASLDYNGLNQSLITSVNVSNSHIYYSVDTVINSSNYLSIGSETKPTRSDAGTYTVYYYAPADNYNEVSGSVTVTINPIVINIPPQPSDKNYTGGSQASGITCPTGSSASGTQSAINAGSYTQTCTLNNSNYKWNDNTITPKDITWVINFVTLNIPPQPSDKEYTGSSQNSGIICPNGSTASGDTSATYPGTYTQTCTLNNSNYKWNDNSTTSKDITWVINKANSTMTLSSVNGIYEIGTNGTITITEGGYGTISCSSANPSIASCSTSGLAVTIVPVSEGQTTLTITSTGNNIYNGSSVTYGVTIEDAYVPIATCPNCVYAFTYYNIDFGPGTEIPSYADIEIVRDYTKFRFYSKWFLGLVLNNNTIERAYVCGIYNEQAYCLEGLKNDGSKFSENMSIIQSIYSSCQYYDNKTFGCNVTNDTKPTIYSDGKVKIGNGMAGGPYCQTHAYGLNCYGG